MRRPDLPAPWTLRKNPPMMGTFQVGLMFSS